MGMTRGRQNTDLHSVIDCKCNRHHPNMNRYKRMGTKRHRAKWNRVVEREAREALVDRSGF